MDAAASMQPAATKPVGGVDSTSLERGFQTFKRGVLGLLFVMANDTAKPETPRTTWFLTLLQMLQVMPVSSLRVC